jgi:hypothetical protein
MKKESVFSVASAQPDFPVRPDGISKLQILSPGPKIVAVMAPRMSESRVTHRLHTLPCVFAALLRTTGPRNTHHSRGEQN